MKSSFQYGLKSRFYGLFSQLPWSLTVTAIVLLPVVYVATSETRMLIVQLAIYWSVLVAFIMLMKDMAAQKHIIEFDIMGRGITVHKKESAPVEYTWEQIISIKPFTKKDTIARQVIETDGVLVKFEDGFVLPVFEDVSNYQTFSNILKGVNA